MSTWTFSLRKQNLLFDDSDSESDTPPEGDKSRESSRDALVEKEENVQYKESPWTIARINAVTRRGSAKEATSATLEAPPVSSAGPNLAARSTPDNTSKGAGGAKKVQATLAQTFSRRSGRSELTETTSTPRDNPIPSTTPDEVSPPASSIKAPVTTPRRPPAATVNPLGTRQQPVSPRSPSESTQTVSQSNHLFADRSNEPKKLSPLAAHHPKPAQSSSPRSPSYLSSPFRTPSSERLRVPPSGLLALAASDLPFNQNLREDDSILQSRSQSDFFMPNAIARSSTPAMNRCSPVDAQLRTPRTPAEPRRPVFSTPTSMSRGLVPTQHSVRSAHHTPHSSMAPNAPFVQSFQNSTTMRTSPAAKRDSFVTSLIATTLAQSHRHSSPAWRAPSEYANENRHDESNLRLDDNQSYVRAPLLAPTAWLDTSTAFSGRSDADGDARDEDFADEEMEADVDMLDVDDKLLDEGREVVYGYAERGRSGPLAEEEEMLEDEDDIPKIHHHASRPSPHRTDHYSNHSKSRSSDQFSDVASSVPAKRTRPITSLPVPRLQPTKKPRQTQTLSRADLDPDGEEVWSTLPNRKKVKTGGGWGAGGGIKQTKRFTLPIHLAGSGSAASASTSTTSNWNDASTGSGTGSTRGAGPRGYRPPPPKKSAVAVADTGRANEGSTGDGEANGGGSERVLTSTGWKLTTIRPPGSVVQLGRGGRAVG